ncbi:hypothetical protein AB8615_05925 [Litorimonas sp. RW-G-Af-16]|uniref:hypothetical protein n=1 Tax=Litorimonas sp. RW-G-Af-16 TaxID=3241168 RepID=UPI003AB0A7A3
MRVFLLISMLVLGLVSQGSVLAGESSAKVMLEIVDGDTAFMIDKKAQKAWWIVGECRRPIPIERNTSQKGQSSNKSMMSKKLVKDVRLGSRQISLEQQFRFNLANDPVSVSVYNSVWGGWSPVLVQVNSTCTTDALCASRMELPEC